MDNKKVIFRNNSDLLWTNYNVGGGVFIDIEPKSLLSVGPKSAEVLRKNLCDKPLEGAKAVWLEEVSEDSLTIDEKKSLLKTVEKINQEEVKKIEIYEAKKSKTKSKK